MFTTRLPTVCIVGRRFAFSGGGGLRPPCIRGLPRRQQQRTAPAPLADAAKPRLDSSPRRIASLSALVRVFMPDRRRPLRPIGRVVPVIHEGQLSGRASGGGDEFYIVSLSEEAAFRKSSN